MRYRRGGRRVGLWVAAAIVAGTGLSLASAQATSASPAPMIGTFTITAGSCSGGTASGTFLRMVLSGGSNSSGPYFSNSDSTCSDNSYTPLSPGTAGGLVTGSYQPQPSPAFDSSGNALSNQIIAPVAFEGVQFSTATNPVDPQTGLHVPAPSVTANGTALSGNLESFGVSWNKQEFNQGSPKPGGTSPGNTTPVTGTYNPATGAYTLQWSSQIVGGPFNGFSAFWNLTGKFIPAAAASSGSTAGTPAASTGQSPSPGNTTPATSGVVSSPALVGSPTTSTTTAPTTAAVGTHRTSHVTLSSRTTTTGGGGWRAPTWLVVLVIVLGLAGLVGVLRSEQALRRQRLHLTRSEGELP
jgi:hypothetical protein